MKYRRLTDKELEHLEQDFIKFLAVNTITANEWLRMKKNEPKKAGELIDSFSDIVFEKTMKKIEHLEFKTPNDIKLFHCMEDKIIMMGLMIEGESDIDFTKPADPQTMLQQLKNSSAKLKIYQAEKQFSGQRDMELFEMMENGCLISEGELFHTLEQLKGE